MQGYRSPSPSEGGGSGCPQTPASLAAHSDQLEGCERAVGDVGGCGEAGNSWQDDRAEIRAGVPAFSAGW